MAKTPRKYQPDEKPWKVEVQEDENVNTRVVQVRTDQAILDPEHELAVQVPEGVGASAMDAVTPIEDTHLESRPVEDVFSAGEAPRVTSPDNSEQDESEHKH